jgi:hypothetical protein
MLQFFINPARYFPVFDLVNIYKDLYGEIRIDANVIIPCSSFLYAEWIGEKLAGAELFTIFASKSPFLVEKLHSYFLGKYYVQDLALAISLSFILEKISFI